MINLKVVHLALTNFSLPVFNSLCLKVKEKREDIGCPDLIARVLWAVPCYFLKWVEVSCLLKNAWNEKLEVAIYRINKSIA